MLFAWTRPPLRAAALVALGCLPLMPTASAADLVDSTPSAGATVTSLPASLHLRFAEELSPQGGSISMNLPDGSTLSRRSTVTGRTLSAPLGVAQNGTYHVTWHATSGAGRAMAGGFDFSVRGQTPTKASGAGGLTPATPSTVAGPTSPTIDEPGDNEPALIIGGLLALSAALFGGWFVARRRVSDDLR